MNLSIEHITCDRTLVNIYRLSFSRVIRISPPKHKRMERKTSYYIVFDYFLVFCVYFSMNTLLKPKKGDIRDQQLTTNLNMCVKTKNKICGNFALLAPYFYSVHWWRKLKKGLPDSMFSLVLCKVNGCGPLDFTYVVILDFDQCIIIIIVMDVWTFFRGKTEIHNKHSLPKNIKDNRRYLCIYIHLSLSWQGSPDSIERFMHILDNRPDKCLLFIHSFLFSLKVRLPSVSYSLKILSSWWGFNEHPYKNDRVQRLFFIHFHNQGIDKIETAQNILYWVRWSDIFPYFSKGKCHSYKYTDYFFDLMYIISMYNFYSSSIIIVSNVDRCLLWFIDDRSS